MNNTTPKIDACDIPQANNIFSLKKLLALFKTETDTISSDSLKELFEDTRAQQYYLAAASRSLGWITRNQKDSQQFVLTTTGLSLYKLLADERQFCQLVQDGLLTNAYYKTIYDGQASYTVIQTVAQELVVARTMQLSTAERRVSSWVSWYHDLRAGITGNTAKLIKARQRARSDVETKKTLQVYAEVKKELYATRSVQVRTFQKRFRESSLEVYGNRCVLTGVTMPQLLVASHIKPVRDCEDAEAVDPLNSLLLEARYDRLFDQGFISFSNKGHIQLSKTLTDANKTGLHIDPAMCIEGLPLQTHQYLAYHRKHVFLDSRNVCDSVPVINDQSLAIA